MGTHSQHQPESGKPPAFVSSTPTTAVLRLVEIAVRSDRTAAIQASLPRVQQTLRLAEVIHRALIRTAAQGRRINCPELTGQNEWGQPLVGAHRHAHVLPVDIDDDGLLDHIVIHAPMGLGKLALRAIDELKILFSAEGKPWLRLQVVASPRIDRWFCVMPTPAASKDGDERIERSGASEWMSATPFVPPRYLKKTGKNALAGQVVAELHSRGYPPATVVVLDELAPRHFDFYRHADHAQPPQRAAYLLRLKFVEPTFGPICLGYASHFGLGLFRALA